MSIRCEPINTCVLYEQNGNRVVNNGTALLGLKIPPSICGIICLVLALCCYPAISAVETSVQKQSATVQFPEKVNRFLTTYCVSCHGPQKAKLDIRLDTMNQDLVAGPHAEDWHEVLDALNKGEMPPEKEKQPSAAELTEVINYLTAAFKDAAAKRRSTGGKVVIRRLTNYEYNNTLNDLLALDENWSKDFPPDAASNDGFKNNGSYMGMSALQMENYVEAAKRALDAAIYTSERPELKKVDQKDVEFFTTWEGDKYPFKNDRNIQGLLFWQDHPRSGPVLVDVTLSGVKEFDRLRDQLYLHIGSRARKKGSPLYSTAEAIIEPLVKKEGDLVRVQYYIKHIEDYPLPHPSMGFRDLVLDVRANDAQGMKVVSMNAQGPYYETWPPKSHQNIFIPSKNSNNEDVYAREIIANFATRAWRRPVQSSETAVFFAAYQKQRQTDTFINAIKLSLVRVLVSPNFLYLVEPQSPSQGARKLTPHELATRLSYFLWSSMPDSTLTELANSGKLTQETVLKAETKRLLAHERSWHFVDHFTSQWLGLHQIRSIAVSPELYPDFDENLKDDLKGETQHFFAYLLRENKSALNFIDSDFTFLNGPLQAHYSQAKKSNQVASTTFKKIDLPDKSDRGGILAHAGILLANSDGEDSHAIARGVWLVDKILGDPPPPPPADVEFDKEIVGFEKMSLKQQLAAHVGKVSCARCHMKFDPFGVAFEHYDAVGSYRDEVRKVDTEELEKRRAAATGQDPNVAFKKIDTDGNGSLSQDEWFVYNKIDLSKAKSTRDAEKLKRTFENVAQVGVDKHQNTHPKNSISLEEFTKYLDKQQNEALANVNKIIPYRNVVVDANVQLPDKTNISGLKDLKAYLLTHKKDDFAENLVKRVLAYALGRSLEFSDDEAVQTLTAQFKQDDYKLASLIEHIVLSDLFKMK